MATSILVEPSPQPKRKRRPRSQDGVYTVAGRSGFWVSYKDARGRRRRHKVAAQSLADARKVRSLLASRAEMDAARGVIPASSITLEDLLERYKKHQKAHWSPSTYSRCDSTIANLLARLPAVARDIRRSDVDAYISKRGASPATLHREIGMLSHAIKLAIGWDLLVTNPCAGVKLPKLPPGKTGFLTEAQFQMAIAAAPDWLKSPIELLAFTGMRRGEMLELRWADVDLKARLLTLSKTKNGTTRVLPLNDHAFAVLEKLKTTGVKSSKPIFNISEGRLSNAVRRLFKRLGFEGLSVHSLRHTHASWLVQRGVDLYGVGQLLGHKSSKMTMRYAHLSAGYLSAASSKLNGILAPQPPSPSTPSRPQLVKRRKAA